MITTTQNSPFGNVVDITHKPRRLQSDNVINSGRAFDQVYNNNKDEVPVSLNLQSVSLEKAIKYYESHETGELAVLYKNTAKWLRELLAIDRYEIRRAMESENTNETAESKEEIPETDKT